jgi:hypothetical protein
MATPTTEIPLSPEINTITPSQNPNVPGTAGTAGTAEIPSPGETTETGETTQPPRELTAEELLERGLERDPNETPEMHALRVTYTRSLLSVPNITINARETENRRGGPITRVIKRPLDIQTAIVLGFMVVKKARYNIGYDPFTEGLIASVNQQLSQAMATSTPSPVSTP